MKIYKNIIWHIIILFAMLLGLAYIINVNEFVGSCVGISSFWWLIIGVAVPILHQTYVYFAWRFELVNKSLSKYFGKEEAFSYYKIGFSILILLRPLTLIFAGMSNSGSLVIDNNILIPLIILLVLPAIYTGYSVKKFFGFDRAYGIDHFEPEKARNFKPVNQGIYKYVTNSMYLFGFLILWAFALMFKSEVALIIAGFNHIYIWVHYFLTEKPDMVFIYNSNK